MRYYATFIIIFSMVTTLLISSNPALALTNDNRYNSGYDHGCSDGKQGGHYYLSGGGASQHTQIFMQGYNDGYAACSSSTGYSPAPPQTSANRENLFNDLNMCKAVENYLVSPCSTYVDSNGVLSTEGQRAKGCISNGIMLTGVGLVSHLPVEMIIGILKPLSENTSCGGIVNWGLLETDVYSASAFLRLMGII